MFMVLAFNRMVVVLHIFFKNSPFSFSNTLKECLCIMNLYILILHIKCATIAKLHGILFFDSVVATTTTTIISNVYRYHTGASSSYIFCIRHECRLVTQIWYIIKFVCTFVWSARPLFAYITHVYKISRPTLQVQKS